MVTPASKRADKSEMLVQHSVEYTITDISLLDDKLYLLKNVIN